MIPSHPAGGFATRDFRKMHDDFTETGPGVPVKHNLSRAAIDQDKDTEMDTSLLTGKEFVSCRFAPQASCLGRSLTLH
jgi:hypothetical protein